MLLESCPVGFRVLKLDTEVSNALADRGLERVLGVLGTDPGD
jgi:hypothetical protein